VGAQKVPVLPLTDRHGFDEVLKPFTAESAALEASRCLDCDDLCSLCVTVCPNRANQAYDIKPFSMQLPLLVQRQGSLVAEGAKAFRVDQRVQTLNIADFCNDCGNCDTFCPAAGAPYKDKPRFWIDEEGYREAKGDAFRLLRKPAGLALEARLGGKSYSLEVQGDLAQYRCEQMSARLRTGTWTLLDWEARTVLPEGTQIDLSACFTLVALLRVEKALPTLVTTHG
jgi:putative selenate reductase